MMISCRKIFGENKQALRNFWDSIEGKTRVATRKLRAVAWEHNASDRTAERNARKRWYPTFLSAVEHRLADDPGSTNTEPKRARISNRPRAKAALRLDRAEI